MVDNIICPTDILWHYGHFAQETLALIPLPILKVLSLIAKLVES